MFNPKYQLNNKILHDLTAIAETKGIIDRAKILPQQELRLRRQAVIRMTHHSTEIEGNQLNMGQVEALYAHKKIDAPDRDIYEVKNYLNALKYIEKVVLEKKPITEKVILQIHKLVTNKTLDPQFSGHYRPCPIYVVRRRFGMPQETLYTGPDAKQVPKLMADFVEWLKDSEKKDISPVLVAGIAHLEIAAIHPFNDGNGRTARALATLVLYQRGYDFRRLFALEDYYNTDRQDYYKAINVGENYEKRRTDITSWLEYFVKGFKKEIDNVKDKILSLSAHALDGKIKSQIYLTPEQLKIIDFLDQVGRISVKDVEDVLSCPRRTAQLQLQKLKKIKMNQINRKREIDCLYRQLKYGGWGHNSPLTPLAPPSKMIKIKLCPVYKNSLTDKKKKHTSHNSGYTKCLSENFVFLQPLRIAASRYA